MAEDLETFLPDVDPCRCKIGNTNLFVFVTGDLTPSDVENLKKQEDDKHIMETNAFLALVKNFPTGK